jgi:hypothetical protein
LKDYLLFDEQLKDTQEKIKEIFNGNLPTVSISDWPGPQNFDTNLV